MNSSCELENERSNGVPPIIFVTVLIPLTICGLFINCIAFIISVHSKNTLKGFVSFLLTLSISQVIVIGIVGTSHINNLVTYSTNGIYCVNKTRWELLNSPILASVVIKACIAFERYLYFTDSKGYKDKMKGLLMYLLLLSPWISMIGYLLCIIILDHLTIHLLHLVVVVFVVVIFVISYMKLLASLGTQVNHMKDNNIRRARILRNIRSYRNIFLLELSCSLPGLIIFICKTLYVADGEKWLFWRSKGDIFDEVGLAVYLFSLCMNPFLYHQPHCPILHGFQKLLERRNQVHIQTTERRRPRISKFRNTSELDEVEFGKKEKTSHWRTVGVENCVEEERKIKKISNFSFDTDVSFSNIELYEFGFLIRNFIWLLEFYCF